MGGRGRPQSLGVNIGRRKEGWLYVETSSRNALIVISPHPSPPYLLLTFTPRAVGITAFHKAHK